jgi:DNA transposition AAA+ family ATPase
MGQGETQPEFTREERARIIRQVADRQGGDRISQREVGLILGCSGGTWSQIASGKYPGKADKYLARADQWLRDRSARRLPAEAPFVETSIAIQMMGACTRAWQLGRIGLVIARAGAGKTMALEEFARRRGDSAVFLRVGELINTKRGLLAELARQLGLGVSASATTDEIGQAVRRQFAAYLGGKGSRYCVLVDEATRIKGGPMNLLRDFSDDPACRVAVVLAGTWELDALIHKTSWIPGGTDQVRSRLAAVYAMRPSDLVSQPDCEAVARAVLETCGHKATLSKAALAYLGKLAQGDGALRAIENRILAARDAAEAVGARPAYTLDELDYAAGMLGIRSDRVHARLPFETADNKCLSA